MTTAIKVSSLSKRYQISHTAQISSFKELLNSVPKAFLRRRATESAHEEEFWALKDISFELAVGRCLGLVGKNGSGKSTMLKLLSRVIPPSSGTLGIRGRPAALLEVGTGFHPELTGRENIYLNGAILGLSRNDVKRNFDSIVAFSEVENFLDTPVKHYSSGMYVRLAYAIAAHVRPDVLIVDEVLAVGDAAFQEKCLQNMKNLVANGTALLFVTHDYHYYAELCDEILWLDKGRTKEHSSDVVGVIGRFKHSLFNE
jgi:lipopolysaccharide transport system ATP-binding protein